MRATRVGHALTRNMRLWIILFSGLACTLVWGANARASYPPEMRGSRATGVQIHKYVQDCADCPSLAVIEIADLHRPATETVNRILYVGRFEVTWSDYLQSVEENKCEPPTLINGSHADPNDKSLWDNIAVTGVSFNQAQCYIQWLSNETGRHYRLPTSEEWEFVARSGSQTRYPWGNELGFNNAFVGSAFDISQYPIEAKDPRAPSNIRKAGLLQSNAYGLYDVIGNASELTHAVIEQNGCDDSSNRGCQRVAVRSSSFEPLSDLFVLFYHGLDQADAGTGFRVVRD